MHKQSSIQKVNNLSPLSFLFKNTKEPQMELPKHLHDQHELIYIYDGIGNFFIENALYKMEKGDLFLLPSNTIHHAQPDKNQLITSSVIFIDSSLLLPNTIEDSFSFLQIFELLKKEKNYKIILSSEDRDYIIHKLEELHQEMTAQQEGYKHASLLLIQQMILHIYRSFVTDENRYVKNKQYIRNDWINGILTYIDDHIYDKLSLTELAAQALVSPSHLSRTFKQTTGMTVTAYIHLKKIKLVKELLLEDTFTVQCIAELLGFDSMPHFYQLFKKVVGTTPAEFRKKALK